MARLEEIVARLEKGAAALGLSLIHILLTLRSGETLSLAEDSSSALGSGGDVRQDSPVLTVNRGSGWHEALVTRQDLSLIHIWI